MSVAADFAISHDNWSDLRDYRDLPEIDFDRMHRWRTSRLKDQLQQAGVALAVLVNPLSLRYAIDYRTYALFQSHVPTTYLFLPLDGPVEIFNAYGMPQGCAASRHGRAINVFDGGPDLAEHARLLADDIVGYLDRIGATGRRVALEYVNPSITMALLQRGVEVVDAVGPIEMARVIKNEDEIACIRWATAVAEHGIAKMEQAIRPGVTEVQLWGLINYTNLANGGDWHDGRMLCCGPRTNPWLQEASQRRVEAGDLIAFDTDMMGPNGYFCDISRTMFCGPGKPSRRQKGLYRLALAEITHNAELIRPGVRFSELQAKAFEVPEEFQEQAYPCVIHAVGMCDEYPRINYRFRGPVAYDGEIQAGMVLCVESYMGAKGERDGVKLEEQVLVTEDGIEPISTYPLCEALLD